MNTKVYRYSIVAKFQKSSGDFCAFLRKFFAARSASFKERLLQRQMAKGFAGALIEKSKTFSQLSTRFFLLDRIKI